MLGLPSAVLPRMDLVMDTVTDERLQFILIVPPPIPTNYVTIKLDGLVHIPNKRRAREARRIRKAMGLWPWGK